MKKLLRKVKILRILLVYWLLGRIRAFELKHFPQSWTVSDELHYIMAGLAITFIQSLDERLG